MPDHSDECTVSDTQKLDQSKGARQSAMQYSSFVYIYRAPYLNNTVNIISVLQALITTPKGHPQQKTGLFWNDPFIVYLPAAGRSEMMFGDTRKGNSTAVFQVSVFKAKTHSDSESLELFSEH